MFYFKIKNVVEFLSEERILSIQDYYKNNKDVLLKKHKNLYKNNYHLYKLKSLMIKNTLLYYSLSYSSITQSFFIQK